MAPEYSSVARDKLRAAYHANGISWQCCIVQTMATVKRAVRARHLRGPPHVRTASRAPIHRPSPGSVS